MDVEQDTAQDLGQHPAGNPITAPKDMQHPPELGFLCPPFESVDGAFCKAVIAEFVHMTLFIFITIGAVCSGCRAADSIAPIEQTSLLGGECQITESRVIQIALTFGFTIAVLVYSCATFSGGHLNPAVTFGLLFAKKVTLQRSVAYWFAQISGAILGSAFVYAVDRTGWDLANGGVNALAPGISQASGWLLESIMTSVLMLVILAATDAARGSVGAHLPILAPFAIGFTVLICHLVAVPLDGTSINPARSFGPAVIRGVWKDQWIFWVGPFSGALIAVLLYEVLFRPSRVPIVAVGDTGDDDSDDTSRKGNKGFLPGYAGFQGAGGRKKKIN